MASYSPMSQPFSCDRSALKSTASCPTRAAAAAVQLFASPFHASDNAAFNRAGKPEKRSDFLHLVEIKNSGWRLDHVIPTGDRQVEKLQAAQNSPFFADCGQTDQGDFDRHCVFAKSRCE